MNSILTVLKKELKDLFRDKKTIIVGILIPLLIFPLIFGLMGKGVEKSTKGIVENMKIALEDKGNSSLGKYLKMNENISIIESNDIKKDVQDGKIYIGVIISENFDKVVDEEKSGEITIVFDDSSQSSGMVQTTMNGIIDEFTKGIVQNRLTAKGIDVSILNPVSIKLDSVTKQEENGFAKFMLSLMLPLLLVMYAVSSPMAAAIDLGAGEKERGTLEPLLTTQASRMTLLFGKLFSVTIMGVIGIVASIIGLMISMKVSPGIFGGAGGTGIGLTVSSLILMGLVTILLTMVFGALELSVSIYARSFKEAQTYLTPLTLVGMAAAYGTYLMEAKNISTLLFNIPIVNVSLVIKELIAGIYNPSHLIITFGWNIVYVAISVVFARYMFSRESVIFRT